MSSEKKFRIQNGLDVAGEVLVNGINIVGADGVLNQASYQTAVQAMIDATVAQGVDQNSIDTAVSTAVAALADSAPETLDTLNELAAALGDDADFATSMTNALNTKLTAANNLSDVADAAAARSNLGLGTAATAATTSFATAAQGIKADNAATQADLTALQTTISAGVATSAQGALADTAVQPSQLTTGFDTSLSTSTDWSVAVPSSDMSEVDRIDDAMLGTNYGAGAYRLKNNGSTHMAVYAQGYGGSGQIKSLQVFTKDGTKAWHVDTSGEDATAALSDTYLGWVNPSSDTAFIHNLSDGSVVNSFPVISGNYNIATAIYGTKFLSAFIDQLYIYDISTGNLDAQIQLPASASDPNGNETSKLQRIEIVGTKAYISDWNYQVQTNNTTHGGIYVVDLSTNTVTATISNPNRDLTKMGGTFAVSEQYLVATRYASDAVNGSNYDNSNTTKMEVFSATDYSHLGTLDGKPGTANPTMETHLQIADGQLFASTGEGTERDIEVFDLATLSQNYTLTTPGTGNNQNVQNELALMGDTLAAFSGRLAFCVVVTPNVSSTTSFVVDDSLFATKSYVDAGIATGVGGVDLSAYTTTADLTSNDLDLNGNKVLFGNVYSTLADLPSATTYHGMFAHVHATGKGYFAHAGNWVELANTSDLLTQSDIDTAVAAVIDSAPDALNTLNELAAALGDDANFASTVTTSLASKADDAATTAALATKADLTYVDAQIAGIDVNAQVDLSDYSTTVQMNTAIDSAVSAVVDVAPDALNTLNELSAALGDDANFATTMTTALATKADDAATTAALAAKADANAVATLAQGALADTAIQPEDLSTGITTASSTSVNVGTLNFENFDNGSTYGEFINSTRPGFTSDGVIVFDFWNNGTHDNIYKIVTESDGTFPAGKIPWSGNTSNLAVSSRNSVYNRFAVSDDGYIIIGDPLDNDYRGKVRYLSFDDVWVNSHTGNYPLSTGGGSRLGNLVDISSYGYAFSGWTSDNGHQVNVYLKNPGSGSTTGNYTITGAAGERLGNSMLMVTDDKLIYSKSVSPATGVSKIVIANLSDGSTIAEIDGSGDTYYGFRAQTDGTNLVTTDSNYIYVYDMTGTLVKSFLHNIPNYWTVSVGEVAIDGDTVLVSSYGQNNLHPTSTPIVQSKIYQFSISSESQVAVSQDLGVDSVAYLEMKGSALIGLFYNGYYSETQGNGAFYALMGSNTTTTYVVDDSVFATKAYVDSGVAGVDLSGYTTTAALTSNDLDLNGNKVLFGNVYSTLADLPSATTYHGMFAHVHATGKGYFAHAGNWVELANAADLLAQSDIDTAVTTAVADVVDAAPDSLNTLNELAAALGDDANFASTVTTSLASKADSATVTASLADKADVTYVNSEIAGLNATIANINVTGDITSALDSYSTTAQMNTAIATAVSGVDLSNYSTTTQMNTAISTAVDGLVDSAPGALDTLNELAAALGDDANFASTVTTSLAAKADANAVATAAQGALADTAIQPDDLTSGFSLSTGTAIDPTSAATSGNALYSGNVPIEIANNDTYQKTGTDGTYLVTYYPASGTMKVYSATDGSFIKNITNMGGLQSVRTLRVANGKILAAAANQSSWQGAVALFDIASGNVDWTKYGASANKYFGRMIAISDTTVAVHHWPDSGNTRAGAVTIYDMAGNELYTYTGTTNDERLGLGLAVSSNHFAYSSGGSNYSGTKQVIVRSVSDGSVVATINDPTPGGNGTYEGDFGSMNNDDNHISMTDSYIAIGAPYESHTVDGVAHRGKVYIYDLSGSLVTTFSNIYGHDLASHNPNAVFGGTGIKLDGDLLFAGTFAPDMGGSEPVNTDQIMIYSISDNEHKATYGYSYTGAGSWGFGSHFDFENGVLFAGGGAPSVSIMNLWRFTGSTSTSVSVDGSSLSVDNADKLDGQHGTHYRINIYDVNGTLVN